MNFINIPVPSSAEKLVLFDIDGTLLSLRGPGVEALLVAYEEVWQCSVRQFEYSMSGKTELQISYELLALAGVAPTDIQAKLAQFWPAYARALTRLINPQRMMVHPGVPALVQGVAEHPKLVLGLLTGNCPQAAHIKLNAAQLHGFTMGVFGEQHQQRTSLPPLALDFARQHISPSFTAQNIIIIGDTPNDIHCAKVNGNRVIAVGTGKNSLCELKTHNPDMAVETMADTKAMLSAMLSM